MTNGDPVKQPATGGLPGSRLSGRAFAITAMVCGFLIAVVVTGWLQPRELTRDQYLALDYFPLETRKALEPFALVRHDGSRFDNASLQGHWSLLFFGYTFCPDICPTTLAVLKQVMAVMKTSEATPPRIVLVSVDPERDTAERLADYVTFFDPSFIGVTGDLTDIAAFATQLYVPFARVPGGSATSYFVDHGANIVVIDPQGRYAGFFRPPPDATRMGEVLISLMDQ